MNLGIDLHDTLTYAPDFFREVLMGWRGKAYVVTGTPASDLAHAEAIVRGLGLRVDGVLTGFDFDRGAMDVGHFSRMAAHKLGLLRTHAIEVYFDDNPFYAEHLRRHGIVVFQTIVSPAP